MKVSSTAFGQAGDNQPAVPMQMARQYEEELTDIAKRMRKYGICQLVLNITPAGPVPVMNPTFKTFDDELVPVELKLRRHTLIRNVLMGIMALYGLSSVTIVLSEDEQKEVRAYWKYLDSGNTEALDKEQFKNAPLRVERDPLVRPTAAGVDPLAPPVQLGPGT